MAVVLCAIPALLAIQPAAAPAASNCCFELAVGGDQTATLDYGTYRPQPYHGLYSLDRVWSIRSIVAFRESAIRHRPILVEKISEAALRTTEVSSLADRHAKLENGIYTYPYEPIPCGSDSSPERLVDQGYETTPAPLSGAVSMPKTDNGYRLSLDLQALFNAQPARCGGTADIALHGAGVDSAHTLVPAPKRQFLELASAGDRKSHDFNFPTVSIEHGGLAGIHTFKNYRETLVRLSWFPPADLAAERSRLRGIKCSSLFCDEEDWGK
jgi:hypothetical protein